MRLTVFASMDGRAVVEARGALDIEAAPGVRAAIADLVEAGRYRVVLDLRQVLFLDSTGLGVLVGVLRRVRQHEGTLELVCDQPRLLEVFRRTGLDKVFTVHPVLQDERLDARGAL